MTMIHTSHFTGPRTSARIKWQTQAAPFPWEPHPVYLALSPEIAAMTQTADFQYQPPLPRWARLVLLGFGGFNFALGALGLILPVLPTTVFWIVAIGCFSKASPRLAARLVAHPRFGRPFADWLACGAIDWRGKVFAIGGMGASLLTATLLLDPADWLLILLGLVWLGASVYLATRPAYCPIA